MEVIRVAYQEQQREGRELGSRTRTRWLALAVLLVAVVVGVVLLVLYGGGSGGGGY